MGVWAAQHRNQTINEQTQRGTHLGARCRAIRRSTALVRKRAERSVHAAQADGECERSGSASRRFVLLPNRRSVRTAFPGGPAVPRAAEPTATLSGRESVRAAPGAWQDRVGRHLEE